MHQQTQGRRDPAPWFADDPLLAARSHVRERREEARSLKSVLEEH